MLNTYSYAQYSTMMNTNPPLQSTSHIVIHTDESEGSTDIAILKLELEDSAVYTVTAENSAGKAQLSFNLRVVGKSLLLVVRSVYLAGFCRY